MDINMTIDPYLKEELELDSIFNKHMNSDTILNKVQVTFKENEIKQNKQILREFQKENLIKSETFFAGEVIPEEEEEKIDLKEIFKDDNNMEINTEINVKNNEKSGKKDKKANYFDNLMSETRKNDFLYCPYLDQFDKFWVQNNCRKSKENTILSCCGCFTNVCFTQEKLKYFTNMYISKEMKNIFLDYFEIYDYDKLTDLFKENINNFTFNKDELCNIGITPENKDHFVGVKCMSCYTQIAVFDSDKKVYYIFNSI